MSNLEFKNLNYVTKKFIGKIQTTENIRISTKREIAKVVSVGTNSSIVSYETTDGQVIFYGKTNIKFLYDDGNGLVSSNYNADFTADIQNAFLTVGDKVIFDVVTVDTKVDTTANTAMLTILLEVTAYAYANGCIDCLVGGENIFVKKQPVHLLTSANVQNLPFAVEQEFVTQQSIDSILLAESTLCVTKHSQNSDVLQIWGNANVALTYTSGEQVLREVFPFDFDCELPAKDLDGSLQLFADVKNTKIRLNIADQVNNNFSVEINGNLQVESFVQQSVDVVVDAYGSDCDLTFEKTTFTTTLPSFVLSCGKSFCTDLPLDGEKSLLTAVNVGAMVTKCTSGCNNVTIDGVVCATAIYKDLESELLEIPFSQKIEAEGVSAESFCTAKVVVEKFEVTQKDNLTVDVGLCFAVSVATDVDYTVISNAQIVPFDKKQLSAMEVCLAHKGETLWELAKNLHMSTEDILTINNDLSDPLSADARIVVFNKI